MPSPAGRRVLSSLRARRAVLPGAPRTQAWGQTPCPPPPPPLPAAAGPPRPPGPESWRPAFAWPRAGGCSGLRPQFAALTPARRPLSPSERHVRASPTLRHPGPFPARLRPQSRHRGPSPLATQEPESQHLPRPTSAAQRGPRPHGPRSPALAGAGSADIREPQPESRSPHGRTPRSYR